MVELFIRVENIVGACDMSQQQEKRKAELARALRSLLKHDAIEKITIEKICQEAGVHRSTFYRYFQDKYDLLHYSFDEFLIARIDENHVIESTISMIAEDKALFRNVSINNEKFSLFEIMLEMVSQHLLAGASAGRLHDIEWVEQLIVHSKYPKLTSEMVAGAILTGLLQWINSNYQMDVSEISDFIRNLQKFSDSQARN